ncbi:MAG: hypothetical protein WCK85_06285 [Chlorobium sp.]
MRKSPLNSLSSIALSVFLWVIVGFIFGGILSENVDLTNLTIDQWKLRYMSITGGGVFLGMIASVLWLILANDNRPTIKAVINRWNVIFISTLLLAILLFLAMVFSDDFQSISYPYFILLFLSMLITAPGCFWLCSLLFTPEQYKSSVLGQR